MRRNSIIVVTAMSGQRRLLFPTLAVALALVLLAPGSTAQAAVRSWTNSGTTPFLWDTASNASWTGLTWAAGDDAVFGATGVGTVNITAAGVTARSVSFNTAGYALNGGTITLSVGGIPQFVGTQSATIDNPITKSGAGYFHAAPAAGRTLTFNGNIDNTGGGDTTFYVNGNGSAILNGSIGSGFGPLDLNSGTTTVTLAAANSFTGRVHLQNAGGAKTLNFSDVNQLGTGTGGNYVAIQGGSTLRYTGTGSQTAGGVGRDLYWNVGAATIDITSATGNLTFNISNSTGDGTGTVYRAQAFTKAGAGQLTLSKSIAYNEVTGSAVNITGGTLEYNQNHASAINRFTGVVTGVAGTQIKVSGTGYIGNDGLTANWSSNLASLDIGSTAAFDLRGQGITVDALTGLAGSQMANSFASGTNVLTVGANGGSGTFAGVIKQTAPTGFATTGSPVTALTKNGGGTQTLSGVNTFTGSTTVSGGTLKIGGAGQLGSGSYAGAITNNATLQHSSSAPQVLTGAITGTGALIKDGAGTLVLASNGSIVSTQTITAGGGTLTIAANTAAGRTLTNNFILTGGTVQGVLDNIGSGGTITVGPVGGNVTHRFTSSGALTVPVAVTANGGVVVGGGGGGATSVLASQSAGGGGGGGVFALSGTTISAGSPAVTVGNGGAGAPANTGGGSSGAASSIAGVAGATANGGGNGIGNGGGRDGGASGAPTSHAGGNGSSNRGGGGGGAGTAGGNAATGVAGTAGAGLTVGGVTYGTGGHGTNSVAGGANTGDGGDGGFTGAAAGAGGSGIVIVQYAYAQSAGTVNLTGNIDVQNTSTLDAYGNGGLLTVGTGTMSGAGGIIIDSSNNAGGVVRYDTATKTYAGDTTINSGATLRQGVASALPNGSGKGNLTANGTFDLNALSATINGLFGSGLVTSSTSGTPVLTVGSNDQTASFSGAIQNGSATSVGLTKTGLGTQTLSGASTYTGVTNVNSGKLLVNGTHTGGDLYTVASGATLGGTGTISASVNIQAGGHLAPGNSIGIINTGSLTVSGVYDVELGTPGVAAAPGLSDRENVTGDATLNGSSSLNLIDNANFNSQGALGAGRYQVVTFSGSRTGTFTNVTGLPASYLGQVIYNGPGVAVSDGVLLDVLDHAQPSLTGAGLVPNTPTDFTLDFGTVDQLSVQSLSLLLGNLVNTPNFTGALDLDSVMEFGDNADPLSGVFSTDLAPYLNQLAGANDSFDVDFDTSLIGNYTADYIFSFSDENGLINSGSLGIFTLHVLGEVQAGDAPAEVPEPASVAVWTLVGLVAVGGVWRMNKKRE